jgi:Lrp/AsnC family transcriptional regulator for asnA, asnC and gidA
MQMVKRPTPTKRIHLKNDTNPSMIPRSTQPNFDKLSRQILVLLQENGRRSFSSIARELDVSEGAVRSRVNHLEKNEDLRFLAVIDPVNVGYKCWAMLGLTISAGASPSDVALEFSKKPQAIWVGVVGGTFDVMVEIWAESPEELQQFLEDQCYANFKIAAVNTMIGMRMYKWGAPQV